MASQMVAALHHFVFCGCTYSTRRRCQFMSAAGT